MQSPPRPQFGTWLLEQLETGHYRGLCYVGPNQFRVPWKHNSRRDCSDEDCRIFRAWAVASGKINEFPNDKARWKTNFRCALNNLKGRFKLIEDKSKSDDPHKIYEIINPGIDRSEGLRMQNSQEDSEPDIYSSPIGYFPAGAEMNILIGMNALEISNNMADPLPVLQPFVPDDRILQTNPVVVENYPVVPDPAANIEIAPVPPSYYEANPVHFAPSPTPPTINDLEVSIFYRKREMFKTVVSCQHLQLHYPMETQDLNTQHSICFPSTECLIDHKQIEYTKRILSSVQRGLLLEVQNSGIFAYRHDRCHVFATTENPNVAHPSPEKLPLNTWVRLLSFDNYVKVLINPEEGRKQRRTKVKQQNFAKTTHSSSLNSLELKTFHENGISPQYTIHLCFGEKFPDGRPADRKLIIVKVVPLICRYFHEEAQKEGASSLNSANISLQTSCNSLMDLINFYIDPPDV